MGDFSVGGAELLQVTVILSRAQLLVPSNILRPHKLMEVQGDCAGFSDFACIFWLRPIGDLSIDGA